MTGLDDGPRQRTEEDFLREAFKELGGPGVWDGGMDESYEAVTRLWNEYEALFEKHQGKWVAVGKDGVLAVCDSYDQALSAVEPAQSHGSRFVIEFLDSSPLPLIL